MTEKGIPVALEKALQELADPQHAQSLLRFFKTGPGQYGEGDRFLGIRQPDLRKVAKAFRDLAQPSLGQLIRSPWHEKRMLGLLILVLQYQQGDDESRQQVFDLYVSERKGINNWDLVDVTAMHVLGPHEPKTTTPMLIEWAKTGDLWERRLAMLATFHDIRQNNFIRPLRMATLLLHDEHDLIHKAVGWLLREIGKRDLAKEESFLQKHLAKMPRTMLRYAIEQFPEPDRLAYLKRQ